MSDEQAPVVSKKGTKRNAKYRWSDMESKNRVKKNFIC